MTSGKWTQQCKTCGKDVCVIDWHYVDGTTDNIWCLEHAGKTDD